MSMTYDPLNLLRDFTMNNKRIDIHSNTHIFFGNIKVPLQHPTAWRKSSDNSRSGHRLSMAVLKTHIQGTLETNAYMRDARKYNVDSVMKIRPEQSDFLLHRRGGLRRCHKNEEKQFHDD